MGKFIIGTFGILGWAFYVMSGGADFKPENRFMAALEAAETPARPEGAAKIASVRPAMSAAAAAPATAAEPVAAAAPITIADAAPAAQLTQASLSTNSAPAFSGETATAGMVEPTLVSLAAPAPAAVASPDLTAMREVAGRAVNMREGPSTSYNVIDTLPQGTQTEVIDSDGAGWVRVRVVNTGQMGWMAERLLTNG